MIWRSEETRQVYVSGTLIVGAAFPPVRPGLRWRWRCWVTGRAKASEGWASTETLARQAVESCFSKFMKSAGLVAAEGEGE